MALGLLLCSVAQTPPWHIGHLGNPLIGRADSFRLDPATNQQRVSGGSTPAQSSEAVRTYSPFSDWRMHMAVANHAGSAIPAVHGRAGWRCQLERGMVTLRRWLAGRGEARATSKVTT